MQSTSETIVEAAMKLPENERLVVVSRLLESMPAEDSGLSLDDDSFLDELDRRFKDLEGAMSWPELRAEE
jgi:putative addiction module component (TIGR02574 family)